MKAAGPLAKQEGHHDDSHQDAIDTCEDVEHLLIVASEGDEGEDGDEGDEGEDGDDGKGGDDGKDDGDDGKDDGEGDVFVFPHPQYAEDHCCNR